MKTINIIFLLLFPLFVFGQIDSNKREIDYTSSGSVNKTQKGTSYLLTNFIGGTFKKNTTITSVGSSFIYGKQNLIQTNKDFAGFINIDLFKSPQFNKIYYWYLMDYNNSYSLKVFNELQTGVGEAYLFINNKNIKLSFSDGIIFDQSNVVLNNNKIYHQTYRNSLKLKIHFSINELITLDETSFLQNSFKESNDYIIKTNVSLKYKINSWLGLTTNLLYNKYNYISRQNLLITYGLTINKSI